MELITSFISDFIGLWQSGGVLMWPLLMIAIFMYWSLFELFSRFSHYDFDLLKQELSEDLVKGGLEQKTIRGRLSVIKSDHLPYFDNRLNFLGVLAGVSPLLGLLGTVMGMLSTFSLMNQGDAKKVDLMAGGISEALITTQMGLIIAVPALLMLVSLRGKRDTLRNFFEKLEAECLKKAVYEGGEIK